MVNDKDIDMALSRLPLDATYYFCAANLPRALPSYDLFAIANTKNLHGIDCGSVSNACETAIKHANKDDVILIAGSIFIAAEALAHFEI